jgi:hypothetical protein
VAGRRKETFIKTTNMGTWGPGYYQDDAALDFMLEVEESEEPKETLRQALETALKAEYLESDEGIAAIVAATYIDRQVNGTRFTTSDLDHPLDVDLFPQKHPQISLADLQPQAVQALHKVLGQASETNELWAENEEAYPAWRAGV